MASQQVIEKLEKLQSELETVSIAIKHIDKAAIVAGTAADILIKIPELLIELKSVEENHRKDLQTSLKEKIDSIEKQLQSLLTELKDKAKQLDQVIDKINKLEKVINDYIVVLQKINFPDRLDKIDNQISSINIGVENLQTAIQNTQFKIDIINTLMIDTKTSIDSKQIEVSKILNDQRNEIQKLKVFLIAIFTLILTSIIIFVALF